MQHRSNRPFVLATLACLAAVTLTAPSAQALPVLFSQDFESVSVNAFPPSWAFDFNSNSETSVQADPLNSGNKVFRIDEDPVNGQNWRLINTWPETYSMSASALSLLVQFRINVDFITNANEGFNMLIAGSSITGAGSERITRSDDDHWYIFNNLGVPQGNFTNDAWHTLRMVLDPSSTGDFTLNWYVDDMTTPLFTENFSGQTLGQTQNIQVLGFSNIGIGVNGATLFIDDVLVAVPEPASLALMTLGLTLIARRRAFH